MDFPKTDSLIDYYRILTVIVFSIGSALLITSIIDPQLPIQIISTFLPQEPSQDAQLLQISQQALLILYGLLVVLVSIFMRFLEHYFMKTEGPVFRIPDEPLSLKFITLISFSATFIGVRLLVTLSGIIGEGKSGLAGFIPVNELWLAGYHIHHFFLGFVILSIVGWITLFWKDYSKKIVAVLYGAGLGIFVDEIGMLLTEGNYFTVSTYVFATILAVAFLIGIYWELKTYQE